MLRVLAAMCLLCLVGCHGKKVFIVACPATSHMRELNFVGEELKNMGHEVYQVQSYLALLGESEFRNASTM